MIAAAEKVAGPEIDWAGLSPLLAVFAGALVVLMLGLVVSRAARETAVPVLSIAALAIAIGLAVGQWGRREDLLAGALRLDELTLEHLGLALREDAVGVGLLEPAAGQPGDAGRVVGQAALGLQHLRQPRAGGAQPHLAGDQHDADDDQQQHADADADQHQLAAAQQRERRAHHGAADEQQNDDREGGADATGHYRLTGRAGARAPPSA
ncbi:MAG: hypothetical protein KY433_11285, partial [Actinobacteria bacterium]|nr:hypothetical protein [Actinomycetota bacterium]